MQQDQNKRTLKPVDLFKAGIIAGDEKCIRINDIVKANSFQIGFSNKNFYMIGAIHTLFSIVEDYGYQTLDSTLCLIANTWAGIVKATSSGMLLGVAEFVHRYGVAEFDKRLCDCFAVVWYEHRIAMRGSPYTVKARESLCRILVEQYNRGMGRSKKRLKWEDAKV